MKQLSAIEARPGDPRMTTFWTAVCLCCVTASATAGDRLEWTGAVTQVEGAAGGGIVPWALIGGLGTDEQFGASAFATYVSTEDFTLRSGGLSVEYGNRVEVSIARQRFDAGSVVPGLTLGQDIAGLKLRLFGDAIFDGDRYLPQVAVGAQWKHTLDFEQIPKAVGAGRGQDVDLYVAATKMYFAGLAGHNLLFDATLRRTRANQFGLLGFGSSGAGGNAYSWEPELTAAVWLTDHLLFGAEYRRKPNNLAAFKENSAQDVFLAWAPVKNISLTAAWADLGTVAGKTTQRGVYVSLWVGI